MFAAYKIVSFSPAGRARNMALLDRYLRANRTFIDRHEWWINTPHLEDQTFIHNLIERYPDFYTAVEVDEPYHDFSPAVVVARLRHFYRERCLDTNAIYLKIDDDFCYVGKDAIADLLEFRIANPNYFLVMPPTVNSVLQTHVLQRITQLPREPLIFSYNPWDLNGLCSGQCAEMIHHTFLDTLTKNSTARWTFPQWEFNEFERATIGATCFFGRDLLAFQSDVTDEDEHFLSCVKPRELNRTNIVAPCLPGRDAFFAHYAYGPQKEYLDKTDILSCYENLDIELADIGYFNKISSVSQSLTTNMR